MDEKLTLNDGTELEGHLIETDIRLFVYVWNRSLGDVFALLNDPEKTKKIVEERFGQSKTVKGYKRLMSISDEGNGMVSASLKKG